MGIRTASTQKDYFRQNSYKGTIREEEGWQSSEIVWTCEHRHKTAHEARDCAWAQLKAEATGQQGTGREEGLNELARQAAERMKNNPATEEEAIEAMTNFIMDTRLGGP